MSAGVCVCACDRNMSPGVCVRVIEIRRRVCVIEICLQVCVCQVSWLISVRYLSYNFPKNEIMIIIAIIHN